MSIILKTLFGTIERYGFVGAAVLAAKRVPGIIMNRRRSSNARFRGTFSSYAEALANVRSGLLAGYDNDAVTEIAFEHMCQIQPPDKLVLTWLQRLLPEVRCILDLGGHMGTKYRAFRQQLDLDDIAWVVYDTPAMVRAGRKRSLTDGLGALSFIDSVGKAPPADLALCSGLLQFLDIPFSDLIEQLPTRPLHLILNKVATREDSTVVMLENLGAAEVPYQIRNRAEFVASLVSLGYQIIDEWTLPDLAHAIQPECKFGWSVSRGYYAKLT